MRSWSPDTVLPYVGPSAVAPPPPSLVTSSVSLVSGQCRTLQYYANQMVRQRPRLPKPQGVSKSSPPGLSSPMLSPIPISPEYRTAQRHHKRMSITHHPRPQSQSRAPPSRAVVSKSRPPDAGPILPCHPDEGRISRSPETHAMLQANEPIQPHARSRKDFVMRARGFQLREEFAQNPHHAQHPRPRPPSVLSPSEASSRQPGDSFPGDASSQTPRSPHAPETLRVGDP